MRKISLLACLLFALTAGCSGLVANKTMSAMIESNATVATAQKAQATTQPFDVGTAEAAIRANGLLLDTYKTATVTGPVGAMQFLVGLFGDTLSNSILVNPTYYGLIEQSTAISDQAQTMFATFNVSDLNAIVIWQDNILIYVAHAKDGAK
jgi:hypothetical protein